MLNQDDFINRLQTIMDYYSVNASYLADYIGVPRSSISHILSQRNKPSLDLILKITEKFSEIDLDWLILGKGEFPKKNMDSKNTITKLKEYYTPELPLFDNDINEIPDKQKDKEIKEDVKVQEKKITKIIFFFDDNSFEIFENL